MNTIIGQTVVLLSSSLRRTLQGSVRFSAFAKHTKEIGIFVISSSKAPFRGLGALFCVLCAHLVQTNAHQY